MDAILKLIFPGSDLGARNDFGANMFLFGFPECTTIASWRRLGSVLERLGRVLERLESILTALEAILAENVRWTCLDVLGTCMRSAVAGGPARGGEHP